MTAESSSGRIDTTRLQRIARAYTESAVFYAAIDLELFTHVSQGAGTFAEIAAAAGMTELNAERMAVVLLAMGLLERDIDGRLVNAPD